MKFFSKIRKAVLAKKGQPNELRIVCEFSKADADNLVVKNGQKRKKYLHN